VTKTVVEAVKTGLLRREERGPSVRPERRIYMTRPGRGWGRGAYCGTVQVP
jgi:hypothetical protein